MADTENLFDDLAGAAGRPVNRPALNAYITQGQALAGLRTAQTESALTNAQAAQEKQQQWNVLEESLVRNGMSPSQASSVRSFAQASGHDPNEILNSINNTVVSNPNAPPEARAAADMAMHPNANPVQDVGNQLVPRFAPNTQTTPTVVQTPMSEATEANLRATAGLHNVQAAAGGFNPHSGPQELTPEAVALRGHLVATGQIQMPTPYEWTRNPTQAAAVVQAAMNENPTLSQALQPTIQGAIRDFSGEGQNGKRLQGYRTVEAHLGLMPQIIQQLGNGSLTPQNALVQEFAKLTGSTAPTNAELLPEYIAVETMRSLSNNGIGTGAERTKLQEAWSKARSAPQLQDAVNLTQQILQGGKNSLATSYQAGTYGMAGKGWVPSFDQIYNGTVGQPPGAAPAAAGPPAAGGPGPGPGPGGPGGGAPKQIVATGNYGGRKVVKYSDGSLSYADGNP